MKEKYSLTHTRWLAMSAGGWIMGILLVVGLALLGDVLLHPSKDSGGQAAVGIGMGAGVGFMQWLALRKHLVSAGRWLGFSVLGFSSVFILLDIIGANIHYDIPAETVLPFATAASVIFSSWMQSRFILQKYNAKAWVWIGVNTLAWMLAYFATFSMTMIKTQPSPDVPKVFIVLFALTFLSVGGPIMGYITGRFIVPFVQHHTHEA